MHCQEIRNDLPKVQTLHDRMSIVEKHVLEGILNLFPRRLTICHDCRECTDREEFTRCVPPHSAKRGAARTMTKRSPVNRETPCPQKLAK